jgi:hypothetical protein
VDKVLWVGYLRVILLLKSFSESFHVITKIVAFDLFIALFNFGELGVVCDY